MQNCDRKKPFSARKFLALTFVWMSILMTAACAKPEQTTSASTETSKVQSTDAVLASVERLQAIEEIEGLRLTFCRSIDNYDWEKLRGVMADDYELYFADETGDQNPSPPEPVTVSGANNVIAFIQMFVGAAQKMIHVCSMPQVEFQSADKASAFWFVEGYGDIAEQVVEGHGAIPAQRVVGYERLEESYERIDGKWRITKTRALVQARISIKQ